MLFLLFLLSIRRFVGGQGGRDIRRDQYRGASGGGFHRQTLCFVAQRVTARYRECRDRHKERHDRRSEIRAIWQAIGGTFFRVRAFFTRRVMVACRRRAVANDGTGRQSGTSGDQGTCLAHYCRRYGCPAGRHRERVRRGSSALNYVLGLNVGRRRSGRSARGQDRRRHATNHLLTFGLATVFRVVSFKGLSLHVGPFLCVVRRTTRVAATNVNQGRGLALRILATSNVQSRNEGRVNCVISESFLAIANVGRRITRLLRLVARLVLNASGGVGHFTFFVCL